MRTEPFVLLLAGPGLISYPDAAVRDDGTVEELVTVRQAARLLGIGRHLLFRAAETGDLAIYDFGGWARCRLSDVECRLERQRRVPGGPAAAVQFKREGIDGDE
jgi:hypothetical protein